MVIYILTITYYLWCSLWASSAPACEDKPSIWLRRWLMYRKWPFDLIQYQSKPRLHWGHLHIEYKTYQRCTCWVDSFWHSRFWSSLDFSLTSIKVNRHLLLAKGSLYTKYEINLYSVHMELSLDCLSICPRWPHPCLLPSNV